MRHISSAPIKRGSGRWRKAAQRPPWTDELAVRDNCTSCGDCIRACPEAILFNGPAGTPVLDFNAGACTFCGKCASACDESVYADISDPPWNLVAGVGAACLLHQGVSCRTCTDVCETRALRFDLRERPVGAISVDLDACTGCGACISICPVSAITLQHNAIKEDAT